MSDIQREARELLYGTTAGEWVMALGADGYSGVDADGSPITWDDHSGEVFKNADAEFIAAAPRLVRELLAENERLTEQSNALNWDTTCLNCSAMLDRNYDDYVRAEKAEAALDRVRALADGPGEYYVSARLVLRAIDGEGQS